jgi:hypothetical protein
MRHWAAVAALFLLAFGCGAGIASDAALPDYIPAEEAAALRAWLGGHPSFRIAADRDCSCDDYLVHVRSPSLQGAKARPNFHPYFVVGDFNHDGVRDMAVGVVDQKTPGVFQIAIFNGPFTTHSMARPAYLSKPMHLGIMIVLASGRPQSEVIRPTGNGYAMPDESH